MLFLMFVFVGTAVACKSASVPLQTETKEVIVTKKEVVHDTIFKTQKDSSYYKSWLSCVQGKVIVNNDHVQQIKGSYLQAPKVRIRDNVLSVDCEAQAQSLFAKWKEHYTTKDSRTVSTKLIEVEKQLSWWQHFYIRCGQLFLLLLLIPIIWYTYKFLKPFWS
jgi:hypothetical protein